MARKPAYSKSVFINCPFTDDYEPIFNAILFAVILCDYKPRSAMEVIDGADIRLKKIEAIIAESQYGIHDISNMDIDQNTKLPRFNMPFELGLFLGAKRYGDAKQKRKKVAIFDRDPYRFIMSISDIRGQDIQSHGGHPDAAIKCVRNWLHSNGRSRAKSLPGAKFIQNKYVQYQSDLPNICAAMRLDYDELTFLDKWQTIAEWIVLNP